MNRTVLLAVMGLGAVLGTTAFLSQMYPWSYKNDAAALINEAVVHGHAEYYGRWLPLAGYQDGPGDYVDWVASASADPKKSEFTISLRKGPPSRDSWEKEAKSPVALIVDGRRFELKTSTEVVGKDRTPRSHFNCEGEHAVLVAVANAKSAEIEFGGKRYDLGDRGLATCRELLKRSEKAKKP